MEKIRIFRTFKSLAVIILVISSITLLFGIILFIKQLTEGVSFRSFDEGWNSILYMIQGGCLALLSGINLLNRKYYIEWDDEEIRMLLPDTKISEKIKFEQIQSVNIRLFEIELLLTNGRRIINLDNVESDDLKKIKNKFENLKGQTLAG